MGITVFSQCLKLIGSHYSTRERSFISYMCVRAKSISITVAASR